MSVLEALSGADTHVVGYERLISPTALLDELPLSEEAAASVARSRNEVAPCSTGPMTASS